MQFREEKLGQYVAGGGRCTADHTVLASVAHDDPLQAARGGRRQDGGEEDRQGGTIKKTNY